MDAGLSRQPVPSAGTGVTEPLNHRSFLQITGCLPCRDGHLVDDPVFLLLLQGGDAKLLHEDRGGAAFHLGSVRPGGGDK